MQSEDRIKEPDLAVWGDERQTTHIVLQQPRPEPEIGLGSGGERKDGGLKQQGGSKRVHAPFRERERERERE
ncbi:hypothetical protein E1301_Tti006358 [Triplophysa tibetana]|uniref:Uncharacterized protein n=1 Tax=Triplophysa tibetana TaxID=1572043 RepID=A0A5A9NYE1_9TELE|nr:hypothetical protein E1301_Tti006358 [Triplophysa tibetana]